MKKPDQSPKLGDIFQIVSATDDREGLVGALLICTEPKSFGVQGFVPHIESFASQTQIYLRTTWDQIEFVGQAYLVPKEG